MRKQRSHKLAVVFLLLAMFCIPFYLEKNQIKDFNNSAFLTGAVSKGSYPQNQPINKSTTNINDKNSLVNQIGNSFTYGN